MTLKVIAFLLRSMHFIERRQGMVRVVHCCNYQPELSMKDASEFDLELKSVD